LDNVVFEPLLGDNLRKLGERKTRPIDAVPTPFPTWNRECREEGGQVGIAGGWNIVVGGVTGTGKSYLALNLAANAVLEGHKVGNINFEMSKMQVATRYASILTGVPKWKLEMGQYFSQARWNEVVSRIDEVYEDTGGLLISNESSVFSLDDIRHSYEALVGEGCDMIIVDYAQLVNVEGAGGIFQRSEAVANELRNLTHKWNVKNVVVSQFNREEARSSQPPTKFGLMGGGVWEHAANQIILINHTLRKKHTEDDRWVGEYTELLVDKNRHGAEPLTIEVYWSFENFRWREEAHPKPAESAGLPDLPF